MRRKVIQTKRYKIIIIIILFSILILSINYLSYYILNILKDKNDNEEILENIDVSKVIEKEEIIEENNKKIKTEKMLELEELQKINSEIIGWIKIEGTNINYPVLQTTDNEYYLNHNYKKEKSKSGSIFLDKDFNLETGSSNYLLYGHNRNSGGLMFQDLLKYSKKDFYESHKTINFTTLNEDIPYEILAVFYSRVYYQNEKNVFRYYYFINAKNENEYNEYVENVKKVSIYDTGVTAVYGEQLLTLSTCEYSKKNGRFVVVAKKITN